MCVLQQICVSYFACIPFICFYNIFFFNATYSRLLIIVSVEGDFDWIIVRFVAMCVSSLTTTSFRNLSVSLAFRIDWFKIQDSRSIIFIRMCCVGMILYFLYEFCFFLYLQPSVSLTRPPVGWHSNVWHFMHSTFVWEWLKIVVIRKHLGHLISMKKLVGPGTRSFNLCVLAAVSRVGFKRSFIVYNWNTTDFSIYLWGLYAF